MLCRMVTCRLLIFVLSFGLSWTSEELLLVATTDHLRYYNVSDPDDRATSIPVINISNAVAVGYDPTEKRIYWSDVREHTISRAYVTGTDQQVLFHDVNTVDGLTLDVINRMLYWTDTNSDKIERSTLDGRSRKTLINQDLDEPRAILLDVNDGRMYWTDWGTQAKIERARLDGTDRQPLITTALGYPNGLVLDPERRLMYWADAVLDRIEVANMDGSSRKTLLIKSGLHPFAIVIIGNYLYWSDWAVMAVLKYDRFDGNKDIEIVISSMPRFIGIMAVKLKSGKNILFLGGDNQIREIYLDIDNDLGKPISSLSGVRLPLSIDFDVNKDEIYWTELQTKSIRKARRGGSDEQVLVTGNIGYPSGLAFSRETNELFWVDRNLSLVEKISLATLSRRTLFNSNDIYLPSDIALDSTHRLIYWTDIGNNTIERATYEGTDRFLILDELAGPIAIALDPEGRLLYWADFNSGTMNKANMDGSGRAQMASGVSVRNLALLGEFLYWSEAERNYTGRINRYTNKDISIVMSGKARFMGLDVIKSDEVTFTDVSPVIGPVAGGTNITIRGHNFLRVVEVQIGDRLKCVIKKMNMSSIIVSTPKVNDNYTGKQYLISVKFTGNTFLSTNYKFSYKPDPTVTSLHPLTTLKRGGTTLTVTGNHLDSVVNPLLKLTRVQQILDINTSKILKETITIRFGNCDVVNRTQVVCITPNFDNTNSTVFVPDNGGTRIRRGLRGSVQQRKIILQQVSRIEMKSGKSRARVKRDVATREIDTIYAGLLLDGVLKYKNLSANHETSKFGKISFVTPPTVNHTGHSKSFIFSPGQLIDIDLHIGRNIAESVGEINYSSLGKLYLGIGCAAAILLVIVIIVTVVLCRRLSAPAPSAPASSAAARQRDDVMLDDWGYTKLHLPQVKTDDYI
ncbi:hypothetical protein LSH36_278g02076 [Paralvinella palmiformis]|uniref:IPT/TIG domain-containing protein n=1 Tax=Paralvinella palmiformis TaxID=53620 RepID=A0AAD9N3V2_9ANNE|nr:hypothetical protein LSH36_278g02076 [Paralvinella palmiformis]